MNREEKKTTLRVEDPQNDPNIKETPSPNAKELHSTIPSSSKTEDSAKQQKASKPDETKLNAEETIKNFNEYNSEYAELNKDLEKELNKENYEESNAATEEETIDSLKEQIEDLKASWSKERAEFINFRKRKQLEYNKNRETWIGNFVSELIPSIENLNRVLSTQTDNKELKQFIQGVAMIKTEIHKIFQNHRVKVLNPVPQKEKFDPHTMEAVSVESAEKLNIPENTIIEVYQPAYILELESSENEEIKLIQPAKVKIAITEKK